MPFVLFYFLVFFLITKSTASIHFSDQDICQIVAMEAEEAFNFPTGILSSIAEVESGRKTSNGDYKPWPWTINDNGKGLFFENRQSAGKYISNQNELNNTQMDIGCMQISVKWHADAFSSTESMLDPHTNIAYAAIFLEELYQTHGNWELAIKYYHSAEKEKNEPYLQKVNAVWKNQPQPTVEPATASASIIGSDKLNQTATINIDDKGVEIARPISALAFGFEKETGPSFTASQEKSETKPSEHFTKSQPHLASEWRKIVFFRELFALDKN